MAALRELLTYLVRALSGAPEQVYVTASQTPLGSVVTLTLYVAPEDRGRVLAPTTWPALCQVLRACAGRQGVRVRLRLGSVESG